ncbi:MAG: YhcN/YlaJ family sporulation lipoprotein [Firmicutes bacterium]|nr:YhcN/YlaJ family sporulation lipoprotein [Bacillota bacterium]
MRAILSVIFLSLLLLAAGCAAQESPLKKPQPDQQVSQSEDRLQVQPGLAEEAGKTAKTVKGVQAAAAVAVNGEIAVAVKVGGFDRLRLKQIKREVHDKIKELNKDGNVYVTSDKKLFRQLQELETQLNRQEEKPPAEIRKRIEQVKKDIQG